MKPKMSITPQFYSVWFAVNTKHEHRLEFILGYQEEKKNLTHAFFTDDLWDEFKIEFKADVNTAVTEYDGYGHIQFKLEAENIEKLNIGLERCSKVVDLWIIKHKINSFKDKITSKVEK